MGSVPDASLLVSRGELQQGKRQLSWAFIVRTTSFEVAIDSSAKSVRLRNAVGKVECCGDGTI